MLKMLNALVAFAFLATATIPAEAQMSTTGAGKAAAAGGGGGGYTGPGDVVGSAVGWWGLRAYSAAYATALGNAVELCPAATPTTCGIVHVTATGDLNSSDIASAGCNAVDTCTIRTLYDQSGNGHNCSQATAGSRPTFTRAGVSAGKPSIHYSVGSNRGLQCTSIPTTAVPWTFTTVALSAATPGANDRVFTATDPNGILVGAGDHWELYAGSVTASTVTNGHSTFYAVVAGTDGTGSGGKISVSGTVTSSLAAGNNSAGGSAEFGSVGSGNINGDICEGGIWGSLLSAGDTTAMNGNMQTYWGI